MVQAQQVNDDHQDPSEYDSDFFDHKSGKKWSLTDGNRKFDPNQNELLGQNLKEIGASTNDTISQ